MADNEFKPTLPAYHFAGRITTIREAPAPMPQKSFGVHPREHGAEVIVEAFERQINFYVPWPDVKRFHTGQYVNISSIISFKEEDGG